MHYQSQSWTEDEQVGLKLLTIIDPGDRISNFIDLIAEIIADAHIYSCSPDLTILLYKALFLTTILYII